MACDLPQDLREAVAAERPLTADELERIVDLKARELGLEGGEVVELARKGVLPLDLVYGFDLALLIGMLVQAKGQN